jgi:hypothetical protein
MKEIKIKTDNHGLTWLVECMNLFSPDFEGLKPPQKLWASMKISVAKKLRKRQIDREGKFGEFTIKLPYHEAFALREIIVLTISHIDSDCLAEINKLRIIADKLHKELQ